MNYQSLFEPLTLGNFKLKNRIALAPLTRARAGADRIPNDLMATYYQQRSGAGLMITEATTISSEANGWVNSPGLYNDEMEQGWKKINTSLEGKNSPLFYQMWHCGRASHSDFHQGGPAVSSSPVKLTGDHIHTPQGKKDYEIPRALEVSEIQKTVQDYAQAAQRAKRAGFAGIEVHGANGYLVNQFLDSKCNQRTDEYGGSVENRFRFLQEILSAVTQVFPSEQVAVRLSPNGAFNDMGGADFRELYDYVIPQLAKLNLGYLHVMDGLAFGFHEQGEAYTLKEIRKVYPGIIMGNCGYDAEKADAVITEGFADLISFGRPFISNPDLPERIKNGWKLSPWDDMTKWYSSGPEGYTDYPTYQA